MTGRSNPPLPSRWVVLTIQSFKMSDHGILRGITGTTAAVLRRGSRPFTIERIRDRTRGLHRWRSLAIALAVTGLFLWVEASTGIVESLLLSAASSRLHYR